jgi:hypothetical protein
MKTRPLSDAMTRSTFLRTLAIGLPILPALPAAAQDATPQAGKELAPDLGNLRAFVELARSDLRTQKALVLAENLPLTNDEAAEFWPVQREYDQELTKLLDRRVELITRYAKQYQTMTDADASKLANEVFDLEEKRTALKRKYFKKFCKVVPPLKAARFFQIENQINMAIDLQIAASLPLIK